MGWYATNLISAFLLPPFNLILLGAAGLLLLKWRPRLGKILMTVTLALLYLLSTPIFAEFMLQRLETRPTRPVSGPFNTSGSGVQAIVVLGSSTYFNAPEYGGHTVSRLGLERIRYAAWLYRLTGKPVLAAGGSPLASGSSEAAQMKVVLEKEFQAPVRWTEEVSVNTRENAYNSFAILKKEGIRHIALVTHAWHMPRAAREFERAGFEVTPAATAYTTRLKTDVFAFIPSASALQKSSWFFHEVTGLLWYRLMPPPSEER